MNLLWPPRRQGTKTFSSSLSHQELDGKELVLKLELSPNQLNRKLKALTNKTLNQYVKWQQLLKAKELLINSDLNIVEIGYHIGFNDSNYFVRSFKKEFGLPPGEFRKEACAQE